jgi:hypothetical protein
MCVYVDAAGNDVLAARVNRAIGGEAAPYS